MNAAGWVSGARRSAGLTQRELAGRSGIPQPTIARIESARQMPRADTLDRLLRACGWELDVTRQPGPGRERAGTEIPASSRPRLDDADGAAAT